MDLHAHLRFLHLTPHVWWRISSFKLREHDRHTCYLHKHHTPFLSVSQGSDSLWSACLLALASGKRMCLVRLPIWLNRFFIACVRRCVRPSIYSQNAFNHQCTAKRRTRWNQNCVGRLSSWKIIIDHIYFVIVTRDFWRNQNKRVALLRENTKSHLTLFCKRYIGTVKIMCYFKYDLKLLKLVYTIETNLCMRNIFDF